jgi:hypothetical protein
VRPRVGPAPRTTGIHPSCPIGHSYDREMSSNRFVIVAASLVALALVVPARALGGSTATCAINGYERRVEFRTVDEQKARENAKAAAELRPPDYRLISPFGYLSVVVHSSTIGSANPKYAEVLLVKDGKVVLRQPGRDKIANIPGVSGAWWSSLFVELPDGLAPPFEVRVVDKLSDGGWCRVLMGGDFVLRTEDGDARHQEREARQRKKEARQRTKEVRRREREARKAWKASEQ